ncbi:alkanesulfonate monooxygenase [Betaproteobacteria bacterium]|nr:alkanesulfonate monooxygenase [Betaproteobacteria bacterium]GHU24191.1 alkanesulfonate monooxygenase [Betaproteobacteria bacterium]
MPVQIIGMIQHQRVSETHAPGGPTVDPEYVKTFAQAHEAGGFDRILVPQNATSPSNIFGIAWAAAHTKQIKFLLAHRPGFVAPTLAARDIATLDHYTGGRLAIHIISGGWDEDQRRDGDFLGHDERYERADEYLDILKAIWTTDKPIDHKGKYYSFEGAYSEVKPLQQPHVPIYFGGASEAAIRVAGRHADAYALWGETLEQAGEITRRIRDEVAKNGRSGPDFSVSFRPVLGKTSEEAWARADRILQETRRLREARGLGRGEAFQSEGARRLLAAAEKGTRLDKRLWTAIAAETGGRSNSTALVGTAEEVADALLDYYDLGITTFLLRGFDPLEDAIEYGRDLIPLIREKVSQRDQANGQAQLRRA